MQTVDIITSNMMQIHGANRVTEKLIFGNNIFGNNGFELRYLISQNGIIKCSDYQPPDIFFSKGLGRLKRSIIDLLKKNVLYKTNIVQTILINHEINKNLKVFSFVNQIDSKPDLVIFQDPFTAYVLLRKGVIKTKSILISHAANDPLEQLLLTRPSIKGSNTEKKLRDIFLYTFTHVTKVVTICSESQEYMKKKYGLNCPCIINGIEDISNISKQPYADQKIHIIILSSVQYRKGHDLAINALSKLPKSDSNKIMLHIVGGGAGLNEIKHLVQRLELGNSVLFHGLILNVENILNKMDAFMLPSRSDTVPIAIIEALRAGLPVFATKVGDIPKMIQGCGVMFSPDVDSIVTIYNSLLQNKYDLKQMSINARKRYLEEFNLQKMVQNYCNVLKQL